MVRIPAGVAGLDRHLDVLCGGPALAGEDEEARDGGQQERRDQQPPVAKADQVEHPADRQQHGNSKHPVAQSGVRDDRQRLLGRGAGGSGAVGRGAPRDVGLRAVGCGTDLRAASLETLIQLVRAGYGITLIPALAMRGSWVTGSGVVAQPLSSKQASRRVSLVYRDSFPRREVLETFGKIVLDNLPNTVHAIRRKKHQSND